MLSIEELQEKAVELLKKMIETPSFSGEEDQTAKLIENFFSEFHIPFERENNNVWAKNRFFSEGKKTILLNSHHDTVKFGNSWTYNPFKATLEGEKLTGLGSNDAGASVVSLLATFVYFYDKELPFNLICAISAEEENSGKKNVASILPRLGKIELGIVGEPTKLDMAIAERGLVVLDCVAKGKTGHAARNEGINAIYKAVEDILWFKNYSFPKKSEMLGEVKMTVTMIDAGKQHNVVPDECRFVVDVRVNEQYSNEEVVEEIRKQVRCEVNPRSYRLNSSGIDSNHPIVKKGIALGCHTFGSPTLSDQAVMPFETIKIGPGDSARSHTPNEYILISEIKSGIELYIKLLDGFRF